ncbi:ankyrin repeat and SOCS box protein 9 isoform X3 [Varanus komodoensis]|uniref:ankyrin repeat and SOCS box protein 9 isoform X3 n=1 Tax=Varanus komodoensis TaxID=61221 RepID=UPI001CF78993|nr:ankyrin repeat and SOCS box protein 9 isoform X3 [Varanus komodoensis]
MQFRVYCEFFNGALVWVGTIFTRFCYLQFSSPQSASVPSFGHCRFLQPHEEIDPQQTVFWYMSWSIPLPFVLYCSTLPTSWTCALGTNVNLMTADCVSPLHEACLGGHSACASVLLKHGAHVNTTTIDWNTPLFNACVSGSIDCLNLLLQHGASPHAASDLASPIHEAAKRGASANSGKSLDSPLHVAAQTSNADMVQLLIDFGANTRALNAEGKKPTELAPPNSRLQQIFLQREGPLSLMQLCRLNIRRYMGFKQQQRISELLLPDELKRFLLYL